ncbi:MAG: glutamate synthase large subunit [Erysipelotrichaceae bacterium]|nr:glutamate synthase large subunit [Erysipelotrichaceae bacterium]
MNTLLDQTYEHDNCGIGAVVSIDGIRTHQTIENALHIVENLDHRAGRDAEGTTGDGVGILSQIPYNFYRKEIKDLPEHFGVGMFFFPVSERKRKQAMKMFEMIVAKEGLKFLSWREVPVHKELISDKARNSCPSIYQGFVGGPKNLKAGIDFDRKLYVARRVFENANPDTYVCSLSSRTIVYKGMLLVKQLRKFYPDLEDEDFISAITLVHSRFSTNTFPSWNRAHPNRYIMHNGEINTIKGNSSKMLAREDVMKSDVLKEDLEKVYPVINSNGSDSAMLDNILEFLMMNGIEMPKAVLLTIPEPWQNNEEIDSHLRDFYEYNATIMEPWDGPASIIFSDGTIMGAVLDRNGLRPSRYYVTKDNYLILSSEVGVLDIDSENIVLKDRLHPGRMLLVDTSKKKIISDDEIKHKYASEHPYGQWLKTNILQLKDINIPNKKTPVIKGEELQKMKRMFDYSYEDIYNYILPIAEKGNEPVISMGADIPLAVMSDRHQPLFNYFKQLFAQVTNPPIDALREEVVTSSWVYTGKDGNLLNDQAENCHIMKIRNPILTNTDLLKIRNLQKDGFEIAEISLLYYKHTPLEHALDNMFLQVDKALKSGHTILILSDRGVDEYHVPLPSLLAVSALHQYLVRTKRRMSCAIILETGEPKEVHHFAALLGYGASAINAYMTQDIIRELVTDGTLDKDYYAAVDDYNHGMLKGVIKIASKMGISTLQSYLGSQNFEAIGIDGEVIREYFGQTISRIGGITLKDIEEDMDRLHDSVYDPLGMRLDMVEESRGEHRARSNKEKHLYNPETIHLLQKAVRNSDYETYKEFAEKIDEESAETNLRGLMQFKHVRPSLPIEEVESEEEIVKHFKTGAMSFGSISREAHETMAIAMNRLQGKSNTGEGGEEENRFVKDENGDDRNSRIKQVASGRFGVTSNYLNHADEIQIKMAQGAKPGEGGQLPGEKVYPWVARARHATPGVSLISPPPHHDIYSIEDLAELIYDLKCANDEARISVKLVSQAGVGTVASGVAKAGSQVILISGYDGGTGAAPKNAVYNAGLPWELGVSETHQSLLANGLRNKVVVEADGKMMSGKDVAIACLLGAEEFGFATAPLVAMGCVMMRVCNLDTCPMGVATQNPELRKRFMGKPEHVENYMLYTARYLREIMAELGFHSIKEMCGHVECLEKKSYPKNHRFNRISLDNILNYERDEDVAFDDKKIFDFHLENTRDIELLNTGLNEYIEKNIPCMLDVEVHNTDRAFGALIGSRITRKYNHGVKDNSFVLNCKGSAGQSFGSFIPKGMTLNLEGDANDYLGKGLSGGIISVTTDKNVTFKAEDNIVIGNVAFYGATSGEAYINGVTGERFGVRNSGAEIVSEGCGDHALEYMTGGHALILGETGINVAAGMSGGIAYIYDPDNTLYTRLNTGLVEMSYVEEKADREHILYMLENHVKYTGSKKGKKILDHFDKEIDNFKVIVPLEFKKMLELIKFYESKGMSTESAELEAFNQAKGGH